MSNRKRILIINSHPGTKQLLYLWRELEKRGHKISFLPSRGIAGKERADEIQASSARNSFLFIVFLPFFYILAFGILSFYKFFGKTDVLVCSSVREKLIAAPAARVLAIDQIWLEYPDAGCRPQSRSLAALYRRHARRAKPVAFSGAAERELAAANIGPETIIRIKPGISADIFVRQDNIFNRLAHRGRGRGDNFFTVGTCLTPGCKRNVEILFRAIKKSRSVIADIQLIIIGESEEKRGLVWLARKMEVDALSWFVGGQTGLKKWLDGLDVYAPVCSRARLGDILTALSVSAAGIPVIAPGGSGLDDVVTDGQNGLVPETCDSDALAQAIIALRQKPDLRARLGAGGKEMVNEYFTAKQMTDEFENKIFGTK